jgi:peptidyl-prolyl cis-trans isomerase D
LRLDGIDPAVLPPLEEIRAEVEAAWQADNLRTRLLERAEQLSAALSDGESFEDLGLSPEVITGISREGTIPDAPRNLVTAIFEGDQGDVFAQAGDDVRAYLVQLDAINEADFEDLEVSALLNQLRAQAREAIIVDLFQSYGNAAQTEAGFTVNGQAVQAIEAQLLGGTAGHSQ